jgi:hypothetical protein
LLLHATSYNLVASLASEQRAFYIPNVCILYQLQPRD